jgi:hypothetical protein
MTVDQRKTCWPAAACQLPEDAVELTTPEEAWDAAQDDGFLGGRSGMDAAYFRGVSLDLNADGRGGFAISQTKAAM